MAATYILPIDLTLFYDANRILELCSDVDNGPAALIGDLNSPGSRPYRIALNAIESAAGEVDSHCQMGKRYTTLDLESLITDTVTLPAGMSQDQANKRARVLQQLVADLAFGDLLSRRGFTAEEYRRQAPRMEAALLNLDRLAQGVQVFNLSAQVDAGVPQIVGIGSQVYRPSLDNRMFGTWQNNDRDRQNGNIFPW